MLGAHASASGDASDSAAAKRRAELLRSPWFQEADRRTIRGGEVQVAFDAGVPADLRDSLVRDLGLYVSALVDRDGWARTFSNRSPLTVLFFTGPGTTAAGWDGRERDGTLRTPVVAVASDARASADALLDAGHQIALLSLRQSAPARSAWAVEGLAEWLAIRTLGFDGVPLSEDDPLLEAGGALTDPPVLAAILERLERRLPKGGADVREAWEQAGEKAGDEVFLRELASRSGAPSLGASVAEIISSRLAEIGTGGTRELLRGVVPVGEIDSAAPSLGWTRVAMSTGDERAGLEIALPEDGPRAARLLLLYRDNGGFDSLPVFPGATRFIPAAGTTSVQIILADGDGIGGEPLRVRRAPEYPAVIASSRAGWVGGGVELAWETSRHQDLLGWVVERREEEVGEPEGAVLRETLPAATDAESATGYLWLDRDAEPGRRYRYRVLALTTDGLLGEAFAASVAGR